MLKPLEVWAGNATYMHVMTIVREKCGIFILWIEVEGLPFGAVPMPLGNLTGGAESDTSHPNGLRPCMVKHVRPSPTPRPSKATPRTPFPQSLRGS